MILEDIIGIKSVSIGINRSLRKNEVSDKQFYENKDLESDLKQAEKVSSKKASVNDVKGIIEQGDVVYNLMSERSAVVSADNSGKLAAQNFIIIKVDPNKCDPWYLCYLLNESSEVDKQIHKKMEGTVIRRVSAATIKNLNLEVSPIKRQQQIGETYRLLQYSLALKERKMELFKKGILETLKQENEGN